MIIKIATIKRTTIIPTAAKPPVAFPVNKSVTGGVLL